MHVITGLLVGGAETALTRLLATLSREEFPSLVISLLAEGPMAERIRALGCKVICLGMRPGLPNPTNLFRLRSVLLGFRPRVLQGWMYHGNLVAWLGARLVLPGVALAWNVRQSLYQLERERRGTQAVIRAGAVLSAKVDTVVYNSELARQQHESIGYRPKRTMVIPNGFDLQEFHPSAEARSSLREELGLPPESLVVGLVNRLHPMKGHGTFLEAARRVLDAGVDVTFVCAGRGATLADAGLAGMVGRLGLGERIRFLGERSDTPRLFAGFDVACMTSSWGDGFPNVVGEAMACGTPCVATDVGDTKRVIGSTGRIVPPGDAGAVAGALVDLLRAGAQIRRTLGNAACDRIAREFSLERCGGAYRSLYRGLIVPLNSEQTTG